jgi:hypothetical protein
MKSMKRWIGPLLLFIFLLVSIWTSRFFHEPNTFIGDHKEDRIVLTQLKERNEKKEETDSNFVQILKELKVTVDGWLKSLNDRIEREDITRFEVRFLEILRSILEWVKEKIDSQLESPKKELPEKKGEKIQETHLEVFPFPGLG